MAHAFYLENIAATPEMLSFFWLGAQLSLEKLLSKHS